MVKQPLKDQDPALLSETKAIGEAPPEALAIVPLRNTVLFPNTVMPLVIGGPASLLAVEDAMRKKMPKRDHEEHHARRCSRRPHPPEKL